MKLKSSLTLLLMLAAAVSSTVFATVDNLVSPVKLTLPATAHSSERVYNLPGLSNVGRVAPGLLRGAQPGREGYATLKAMGVRTVIDMRTSESEKFQVEAAGMRAIAIPIEI